MITDQISLLNKTILNCLNEKNEKNIVKAFTDLSIKILEGDFGFAWLNSHELTKWSLAYKSPNLPYNPVQPKEKGRNRKVIESSIPNFVTKVKKRFDKYDVSPYMKSFVIIPISSQIKSYGNIVICFKKEENFLKEKRALSAFIGSGAAQAITIHRLAAEKRKILILAAKHKAKEVLLTAKQKATQILLAEEKLKTEFIANSTHEFRTPLAIMRGYVDLAMKANKEKKSNELQESRNAFKSINTEIIHLSEMLTDLVLITSEKNNKTSASTNRVDIVDILQNTEKRLRALAKEKKIFIEIKGKINSIFIEGDKKYLERLFINLLENAITYGKSKITVEVSTSDKKVIVSITDDGIGISKEDLPNIFERFYQADKSHSSYGKHSGLGLAIAKWITEIHKGKIKVKSVFGKSSTFTIILPQKSRLKS